MAQHKKYYKTIFLSDTHIGSSAFKAEELLYFLNNVKADNYYLIGDIIDLWSMKKKIYWPQKHNEVIRKLISKSKNGSKLYYILGNHDDAFRDYLDLNLNFGNIYISNEQIYETIDGRKFLIIHGDLYDALYTSGKIGKVIMKLGTYGYMWLLRTNTLYNKIRKKCGYDYWSLSSYIKLKSKKACNIIFNYETSLINEVKKRKLDGVICGHIHFPTDKIIDGIQYFNDGDWCENCTALVENFDGSFELINYKFKKI